MALVSARMLLIGCLFVATSTVSAESERASVQPADVQAAAEENPMICKRMAATGSRIARRYCRRKSEWDGMREDGQRAAQDAIITESQYGYRGVGPGGVNPY